MGDRTNSQDQGSNREYVHWFCRWVESFCPGVEKFMCLVDERSLVIDVSGIGED